MRKKLVRLFRLVVCLGALRIVVRRVQDWWYEEDVLDELRLVRPSDLVEFTQEARHSLRRKLWARVYWPVPFSGKGGPLYQDKRRNANIDKIMHRMRKRLLREEASRRAQCA